MGRFVRAVAPYHNSVRMQASTSPGAFFVSEWFKRTAGMTLALTVIETFLLNSRAVVAPGTRLVFATVAGAVMALTSLWHARRTKNLLTKS
jgi:hypothetical protein